MFEFLGIHGALNTILEWIVGGIFIKGLLFSDITQWIRDRFVENTGEKSFVYHLLDRVYFTLRPEKKDMLQSGDGGDAIVKAMKQRISKVQSLARKVAIVQHYSRGHEGHSPLGCNQGKCTILFT